VYVLIGDYFCVVVCVFFSTFKLDKLLTLSIFKFLSLLIFKLYLIIRLI
jgi:hypothetical protein